MTRIPCNLAPTELAPKGARPAGGVRVAATAGGVRVVGLALAAAMMAALLAGCADGGPSPGTDLPAEDEPAAALGLPARELPWSLTACTFAVALVPAAAAAVALHLPEGFRSLSLAEVGFGGVAPPSDDGNVGVELFDCADGDGLEGPLGRMAYASVFTAVEPPEELRQDVDYHFVKWDVLVPDADRRALLVSYGIPAVDGSVAFAEARSAGPVATHSATLTLAGHTYGFLGAAGIPQEAGRFVEFQATPGGLASWSTSFAFVSGGLGPQTVTLPAGSLAAELAGAGEQRGVGFAGMASFTDGLIALPAQPATAA